MRDITEEQLRTLTSAVEKLLKEKFPSHCTECGGMGGEDLGNNRPDGVVWADCLTCLHKNIHPLTGDSISEEDAIQWVDSYFAQSEKFLDILKQSAYLYYLSK